MHRADHTAGAIVTLPAVSEASRTAVLGWVRAAVSSLYVDALADRLAMTPDVLAAIANARLGDELGLYPAAAEAEDAAVFKPITIDGEIIEAAWYAYTPSHGASGSVPFFVGQPHYTSAPIVRIYTGDSLILELTYGPAGGIGILISGYYPQPGKDADAGDVLAMVRDIDVLTDGMITRAALDIGGTDGRRFLDWLKCAEPAH